MPDLSDVTPQGAAVRAAKSAVRARLLAARRSLSAEARRHAAVQVRAELLELIRATRPSVVAGYAPMASEPGGPELPAVVARELEPAGRLLLPVLQPDLDLDWALFAGPASLPAAQVTDVDSTPGQVTDVDSTPAQVTDVDSTGSRVTDVDSATSRVADVHSAGGRVADMGSAAGRGLREPTGGRLGVTAISDADLVIVPALAVDVTGVRLGRGGGSYDRALARVGPAALIVALLYDGELVDNLPAEQHDARVHAAVQPTAGLTHLGGWTKGGEMAHY